MRLELISLGLAASVAVALPARAERCSDAPEAPGHEKKTVPAPEALVVLDLAGGTEAVWPYTSADLTDTPKDPLNVVFTGAADPRQVRAALLALDGDRTGFGMPDAFPFNCTWADAIGRQQ